MKKESNTDNNLPKSRLKRWIGLHLTSSLFMGTRNGKGDLGSGMNLSSVILISYRNIAINKARSILTIGGVAVGIGIITFLLALGFGVQDMVIREVTKSNPTDIVDISNENLENFVMLDEEMQQKIRNINNVKAVEMEASLGGKFMNGDSETDAVLYGVSDNYLNLARNKFNIESKKDFTTPGGLLITPRLAVLLGYTNPSDAIGSEIKHQAIIPKDMVAGNNVENDENLKSSSFEIVGIIKDKEREDATYAYTMMGNLRENYGIISGQSAKVQVSDSMKTEDVRSQIEQMGFLTESVVETINDINSFFMVVRVILVVFGTIIMSISAMGMLNTLSVSLLQRTKEVGILKALGMRRKDIFKMFIFEAILISFSGGLLGLAGGYMSAKGVNRLLNFFAQRQGVDATDFVYIPTVFVVLVVSFIVFLGFATGLLPARRAAETHALDALRYE